jgi:hypothetical protein
VLHAKHHAHDVSANNQTYEVARQTKPSEEHDDAGEYGPIAPRIDPLNETTGKNIFIYPESIRP